ncbi:formyltransferase family protein [Natranaeroarchaeum sulfidigenes]|uniref:Folate-dependent phosphoribosylglycinamide formyltransferase PurN n=1 Tax=Natranaeroarchaeum sulfidigenes TaxID=2784880 RepID=A0A897MMS7_9EURY|nr:formyltransferase family protein [Natranaeroarchaeum sulfidigenes]QSG01712.1 Folate-dependent phosphoribosylglycinamide formyltransferase PurN [Natranaeroarchaeum sulfidigenes]
MTLQIAIVTQDDPFYMPAFFQEFIPKLDEAAIERMTILNLLDEALPEFAMRMFNFYGPVNFTHRSLSYVYRKASDALSTQSYSVASVARNYGISIEERHDINAESYIQWVEDADIDILLSVSAPQIFEERLLNAPSRYCLNVHTAELPKYRGMLPTFWALYHGENEIGTTVHTMVPEIDKGQIVKQQTFPVSADMTLDDAILRGKREGGQLAAEAINEIADGTESTREMTGEGSYFSFPTKSDRKEFQKRGNQLI